MSVFLNRDERFECERDYHSFLCRDKLSFLTFLTQESEPEMVKGNKHCLRLVRWTAVFSCFSSLVGFSPFKEPS